MRDTGARLYRAPKFERGRKMVNSILGKRTREEHTACVTVEATRVKVPRNAWNTWTVAKHESMKSNFEDIEFPPDVFFEDENAQREFTITNKAGESYIIEATNPVYVNGRQIQLRCEFTTENLSFLDSILHMNSKVVVNCDGTGVNRINLKVKDFKNNMQGPLPLVFQENRVYHTTTDPSSAGPSS